jgi:NAD/NADP transhydrogenase beta subunit
VEIALLVAAAVLGNLIGLPIGGTAMPVVIALLNACTACPRPPRAWR